MTPRPPLLVTEAQPDRVPSDVAPTTETWVLGAAVVAMLLLMGAHLLLSARGIRGRGRCVRSGDRQA
jgi:hypothetical protein